MKKWGIRLLVIIVVAGISILGISFYRSMTTPQKIHIHAGFIVFDNDKKLDFSDDKYMNIKPCSENEEDHEDEAQLRQGFEEQEDEQLEKAHLHDNVGNVVHVERSDGTWKDLFSNINFPINYSEVTAYINGQEVRNFPNQQIHEYDSAIIFIGKVNTDHLKEAVTKEHIIKAEKTSEDCGE